MPIYGHLRQSHMVTAVLYLNIFPAKIGILASGNNHIPFIRYLTNNFLANSLACTGNNSTQNIATFARFTY